MVTNTSRGTSGLYFRTTVLSNIQNNLSNNISSTVKLFADDTSIFSIVHDIDLSFKQLSDDLKRSQIGPIEKCLLILIYPNKLKK